MHNHFAQMKPHLVLRILFRNAPIEESDEDKPGIILDYDKDGNVVGLEVLNASQCIENPLRGKTSHEY